MTEYAVMAETHEGNVYLLRRGFLSMQAAEDNPVIPPSRRGRGSSPSLGPLIPPPPSIATTPPRESNNNTPPPL